MKKGLAALTLGSVTAFGAADAAVFNVQPLPEQAHQIAQEQVTVRQIENRVEAHMPWKGEPGLVVSYDMGAPSVNERVRDKRSKQVIVEPVDYGDGGMKVDILLNSKPDTNRFCYQIEGWENYDFFYQPSLTEEYPDTANGLGNDTWRVDPETGQRFEFDIVNAVQRPEEIVGSYAVYHKSLRNHKSGETNYETGKVAHIPYPYVWEVGDEENKLRAEDFSIVDGEMCVTVQQDFLDTATYPVRVDPTFGYTTVGESTTLVADDRVLLMGDQTLSESGTLDSMSMYRDLDTGANTWKMAIYNNILYGEGPPDRPYDADLVGETEEGEDFSDGWNTLSASGIVSLTSGDIGLAWWVEAGTSDTVYYDVGANYAVGGQSLAYSGAAFPDPYDASDYLFTATHDLLVSIYATYTADAGEPETTVTPVTSISGDVRIEGDVTVY